MSLQQNLSLKPFVDYIPAELHECKTWHIVYYVINPETEKLARKRNRVKPLKSLTERRKLAKRMVIEINNRLQSGWNPFLEKPKSKDLTKFVDAVKVYTNRLNVEFKDGNISFDTHRTYLGQINKFIAFLELKNLNNLLCYKLNDEIINEYLDDLRYNKNLTARTRNNAFTFIRTLCLWLLSKKYLNYNPCESISKLKNAPKNRIVIPADIRIKIFDYYKETNPNYLALCMTCYYCLIRRTELSKIKVSDVNLNSKTLFISAEDSKSNKSGVVTIPDELTPLLKMHLKDAKQTDFLFSDYNYATGNKRFNPNKCTSNWSRMRKKLNLPINIKWYSLKDTGITDLIISGTPLLSVRDQARHYSIKQTDEYTPKNMKKADFNIINSGVKF